MSRKKKKKNQFLQIVKKTIVATITPFLPFIIFVFAIIFIVSTIIDFFANLFNANGITEYDMARLQKVMKEEYYISEDVLDEEIEPLKEFASQFTYEYNNNNAEIDNSNSPVSKDMFIWPIPGYTTITSHYGMRVHPITKVYKLHTGTDISAPTGANFIAMADGTVEQAYYNTAYGNMVLINHGNSVQTLYAHGSEILVNKNDKVKQGTPVLKVGSTGYSTGPHAHFEVRINGEYTNPEEYFDIGEN